MSRLKIPKKLRAILSFGTLFHALYITAIVASLLFVPYHNIRTGFTAWTLAFSQMTKGPVNVAVLNVQRIITVVFIGIYVYYLLLQRRIRNENIEIDLAIRESEDRRHRVEREYFKLKRQMQDIFDTMSEYVMICGKDFKIEFLNKALKQDFGEGVGKKCFELLFGNREACPWCVDKRVFKGEIVTWEHKNLRNNHIYRIHNSPFVNQDGTMSIIYVMQDVTQEKETQQKLKSSEEHFRNLFENLPIACFGYDQAGFITSWNNEASRLYGFKKEEIIGRSLLDTIALEKDREQTLRFVDEVFKGKSFTGIEWEDRTSDGSTRYVYTNTYPIYDAEGKVALGISANIDITPHKKIEYELKTAKEHFEKIVETPKSLILELDHNLKIKMFNKGCEEVMGYTRQEALGRDWIQLAIPDRLKETVRQMLEEIKQDRSLLPSHFESPVVTKAGRERIIFWSNANLKDDFGNLVSIIAMGDDVTNRKRIQQKIVEDEEKYRTFLETVPIHVGAIDESGKFTIWNRYSEVLLGYTKQEVIGKITPQQLYEDPQMVSRITGEASRTGIFDQEVVLISKEGRKIPVRLVVTPRQVDGRIVGFYSFAEDITERKSAETELLLAKEKLEKLALKDVLTELYNNRYIVERLHAEFERTKRSLAPLSVLLLDLDYFKSYNDTYGRDFGNKILVQVGQLLRSELRVNDIVARWGGEEFMVIFPETSRDRVIAIAQKIYKLFSVREFGDEQNKVKIKCSVGVASYPEDSLFSPKEMVAAVEQALLKVKSSGGNSIASYKFGLVQEYETQASSERERLIKSLKKKMSFLALRGEEGVLEAIHSLSKSLELKDHSTRKHSEQTVHFAVKLAQRCGMTPAEIDNVRRAAILHDIGKLGIPDEILLKKGPLSEDEFTLVKQHSQIAADIMSSADFLKNSIPAVLYHHERFDGSGYPEGLKAESIPLAARIIAVVDVYESLTSDRPYHRALSKEEALQILRDGSGTKFDSKIVDAFIKIIESEEQK